MANYRFQNHQLSDKVKDYVAKHEVDPAKLRSNRFGYNYNNIVDILERADTYGVAGGKHLEAAEKLYSNIRKMSHAKREKMNQRAASGNGLGYDELKARAEILYTKLNARQQEKRQRVTHAATKRQTRVIKDLAKKWNDNVERHLQTGLVDYELDAPVLANFYKKAIDADAKQLIQRIDEVAGTLRGFRDTVTDKNPVEYLASKDVSPYAKVAALRILQRRHDGDFGAMIQNLYREQFEQVRAEVYATKDSQLIGRFKKITKATDPKNVMTLDEIAGKEPAPVETPAVEKKQGIISRISGYFGNFTASAGRVAATIGLAALLSCGKGETPTNTPAPKPETPVYVPENTKGTAWVPPYNTKPSDEKKAAAPETKAPVVEKTAPVVEKSAPVEDKAVKVEVPTPKPAPKEDKPAKETPKEVPAPVKPAEKPVVKTPEVPSIPYTPSVPYSRRDSDVQLKGILKGEMYLDDNMSRYAGNGKAIIDLGRTGIDFYANVFDQKQEFDSADVLGTGGRAWGGLHHYLTLDKNLHLYMAAAGGFEKRDFTIEPKSGAEIDFGNESPFLDVAVGLTGSRVDDEDFGVGSDHSFLLGRVTKHFGKATGDVESLGFSDEYEALRAQLKFQLMLDDKWSLNGGFSTLDEKIGGDFLAQRNWAAEFGPRFRFTIDESPAYIEALGTYRDLHSEFAGQESDDRGIGGKVGFGWRIINGDGANVDLGVDVGGWDNQDSKDEWFVLPSVKVYLGGSRRKR